MWQVSIYSQEKETKLVELRPGKLTLGRAETNDIIVEDSAASRQHAEIIFDASSNIILLIDLNSTNGTYVNQQLVLGTILLNSDDLIQIGQFQMRLQGEKVEHPTQPSATETHKFTQELLMESLDQNSAVVYEVSRKLNPVTLLETAIEIINLQIKQSLGVDYCQIIKIARLHEMHTSDFTDPLAKKAAFTGSAELTPSAIFVPIMNDEYLLGVICVRNNGIKARPFGRRDLLFVIAVSQQAALVMQRMQLMEMARREEQVQRLLLRFVSPNETETILKDFFEDGELPGLKEQKITVLFSNVANSAELAEHLGTEHFASMLNGFYQVATQIVFKQNGMVKYLGDGILAIFTEQLGDLSAEEKAVLTGREFVKILHHTGSLDAKQRIVIGVAINTGPAMVGFVGAKDRAEFNVIGDIVNVAFRMQEFARPYKIIADPATVAAIGDTYQSRRAGSVSLGEREQSVQVFEILP